jgi:hypothetical protein
MSQEARLRPEHLRLFLTPMTLADAREKYRMRLSRSWWAAATAASEQEGLIHSPGKGPEWVVTWQGAAAVALWSSLGRIPYAAA